MINRMTKFLILISLFLGTATYAQPGYEISIQLKPYANSQIYLGYYYGKVRALADSTTLNNNATGVFKGKESLPGGIYFIVSPSKQILFELLIDKNQRFSIVADSSKIPEGIVFTGSPDNKQFHDYSAYSAKMGKQNQFAKLQHYRDSIVKKYPESFLSTLFLAMYDPKIPPASKQPGGKYDSNYVYEYFKEHYWDNVSFTDSRLVRTPFFEDRLEKYYKDLVSPNPDSLIKEIDYMLLYSRSAEEMYKYLMITFVQKYVNPQYMGQDAVFVHLFEKYINTGKAEFFTNQYKEFATKRAYSLMANLIGRQAPVLDMVDTVGKALPLYSLKGDFTVICFWDPTCSHCKEIVPKVDSIFKAKWKNEGVEMYGVKTDGTMEEWKTFIADNHLSGWNHVYQLPAEQEKEIREKRAGYKQLYDVYQTPMIYLLDKDKRIIAKKLTYLQTDEVINEKLRSKK
jgi:hypothetical protein